VETEGIPSELVARLRERAAAAGRSTAEHLEYLLEDTTEAALPPQGELFRLIAEHASDGIVVIDGATETVTYASPAYDRMWGRPVGGSIGLTGIDIYNLIHPDDRDATFARIRAAIERQEPSLTYIYRAQHPDGKYYWKEDHTTFAYAPDGTYQRAYIICRDITERIKSQQTLKSIFEQAQDAILLANDDATYIDANPAACQLLGYSREELIGMTVWDLTPERYREVGQSAWEGFAERGEQTGHYVLLRKDGSEVIVEFIAMRDILPDVHLSLLRDITERLELEKTLRESEARLRSLLESQTAYMVRINRQGQFTYANRRYLEHYSWTFSGKRISDCNVRDTVVPEDLPEMERAGTAAIEHPGTPVQVILRKPMPNATPRWTLWEFVALKDEAGQVNEVQCIGFDVTDHQQAQEQIKLQNIALEAAANAIAITDRNGRIEWINPAFTRLTGYTMEDAQGHTIGELQRSRQQSPEVYRELWDTILSGKSWSGKLVNQRKDGSLYTEEQTIAPVEDEEGAITHFIAIKQDVTEREHNEQLKRDYEQVKSRFAKEREQNALIQRIISALSHDLRTPLAVIQSSKDKLALYSDLLSEDKRQEALDSIGRQVQFTVNLLDDTVQLARGQFLEVDFNPEQVNLALLCQISMDEVTAASEKHQPVFVNLAGIEVSLWMKCWSAVSC